MTLITPDLMESQTEDLLESVMGSIRSLRQDLEDLKTRVRQGDGLNAADDKRTVAAAVGLLETCQKVEYRLAECRIKNEGIARGGYALDLEKARADIGCKLARLRCARDPERFSE